MFLNRTDMLDEEMPRLGRRTHRQYGLIEGVHQAMHLAQQQRADAATPRACPDAAASPEEPGVIFLVRCTRPAERGSNGARDLVPPSGIRPPDWSSGLPAGSRRHREWARPARTHGR